MANSDDVPEDVETEVSRVRDSLPVAGIAQGSTVTRMMTLEAARALKHRAPRNYSAG